MNSSVQIRNNVAMLAAKIQIVSIGLTTLPLKSASLKVALRILSSITITCGRDHLIAQE